MFDRTLGGNWVVLYKSPYTGNIMRSARMKRRYAKDRFKMHGDAICIEKVSGLFQRRIIKKGFEQEIANYLIQRIYKLQRKSQPDNE